ncbi:MAG: hypothetical protein WC829_05845 [Hyphomicrobium sp.]|jgi:hypothetical protein
MRVDRDNPSGGCAPVRGEGVDDVVTPFPKKHVIFHEPDADLIKHLELLLEQAKKGDLRAIAEAVVYRDDLEVAGETNTGWYRARGAKFALGYAIGQLQHRFFASMDDPAGP